MAETEVASGRPKNPSLVFASPQQRAAKITDVAVPKRIGSREVCIAKNARIKIG